MILYILAIYGLYFGLIQSSGPWNICSNFRNWLMRGRFGPFWFSLMNCPFCSGCYCGLAIYLLTQTFNLVQAILWFLSGGVICLGVDSLLNRINKE
jgi:hypothetical protein